MLYDSSPFSLLEAHRAQLAALRENASRMAKFYATWTTKGVGEIMVPTVFAFDIRFLEEPCFTSGVTLAGTLNPVTGHFPRATCGVYDWRTDTSGYYTGAYLYFCVDANGGNPNYEVVHHLAWEAAAIKDLPAHLLDF